MPTLCLKKRICISIFGRLGQSVNYRNRTAHNRVYLERRRNALALLASRDEQNGNFICLGVRRLVRRANHVRTPLARVGQEGERQPRLRPAMEAVRLGPGWRARPALDHRLASRSQPRASSSPAELRRPWQARKRHRFEARPAEVETRLAVAINEALHKLRRRKQ